MKTEEYIIILVGVTANDQEVTIRYTSEAHHSNVSIQVTYSNGKVIKTFEQVKNVTNGILSFSAEGLFPGSYTCTILESGRERGKIGFSIG